MRVHPHADQQPIWTLPAAAIMALLAWNGWSIAAPTGGDMSRCRALENLMARLRCYENLSPPASDTGPAGPRSTTTTSQAIGRWRLVRTPHPQGEKDAISIMRSGELAGSDPDFAGLMIRCGDDDIEVLLVLLRPLPLRARPTATINGTKFEARVVPPGAAVLLPPEVTASARERWPSLSSLSFEVEESGSTIKGRIVPDDLGAALKTLTAVCATR